MSEELVSTILAVLFVLVVVQGLLTPYLLRLTGIASDAVRTDVERGAVE